VEYAEPDPDLNEGRPAHNIPGGKASASIVQKTDEQHPRIEASFQRYIYRADPPAEDDDDEASDKQKHEFEVIVCHANVVRYFLFR
jgi:serine/threonine-protein phosphatase PGAM5